MNEISLPLENETIVNFVKPKVDFETNYRMDRIKIKKLNRKLSKIEFNSIQPEIERLQQDIHILFDIIVNGSSLDKLKNRDFLDSDIRYRMPPFSLVKEAGLKTLSIHDSTDTKIAVLAHPALIEIILTNGFGYVYDDPKEIYSSTFKEDLLTRKEFHKGDTSTLTKSEREHLYNSYITSRKSQIIAMEEFNADMVLRYLQNELTQLFSGSYASDKPAYLKSPLLSEVILDSILKTLYCLKGNLYEYLLSEASFTEFQTCHIINSQINSKPGDIYSMDYTEVL